jgi:hypothetical protein
MKADYIRQTILTIIPVPAQTNKQKQNRDFYSLHENRI